MRYCPSCRQETVQFIDNKVFRCSECSFEFYFNAASAVGAVIAKGNKVAVGIRAGHPAKGLYDFPGGFLDPGETLEQGMARELEEELGQKPTSMRYLMSSANDYHYNNVDYTTCDAYFLCEFEDLDKLVAADDIDAIEWVDVTTVDYDKCAFDSTRNVFKFLQANPELLQANEDS